jgi:hypothetical protein
MPAKTGPEEFAKQVLEYVAIRSLLEIDDIGLPRTQLRVRLNQLKQSFRLLRNEVRLKTIYVAGSGENCYWDEFSGQLVCEPYVDYRQKDDTTPFDKSLLATSALAWNEYSSYLLEAARLISPDSNISEVDLPRSSSRVDP